MLECMSSDLGYGNSASITHALGDEADRLIERARAQVASAVGCAVGDVIWTSGATEADNLAVLGVARYYRARGTHVVTSRIEHRAVLAACQALQRAGWSVTYLEPDAAGCIGADSVAQAITAATTLVSIMHVNNEIGAVQEIEAIARTCRQHNVPLHIDAAQSVGKVAVDLRAIPAALVSLSAHKSYGPKGIGALVWLDHDVFLEPLQFGGGQEEGLRPGTLPTHQIVGMGEAFEIAAREQAQDAERASQLRSRLWERLSALGGVLLNGGPAHCAPQFLNVSFEGVEGESLIADIRADVAVSVGAACSSASREPSAVLRALGRSAQMAESSLRFSIGRFTTAEEIERAADHVEASVRRLRALSCA